MRRIWLPLALLAFAMSTSAQEMATTVKSSEVVPGIYMIEGADGFGGGNMGLVVGRNHVVLIDDGIPPIGPSLVATINGITDRPVDFVLNTHVHGDHVGTNATFAENGSIVIAHHNIRKRLSERPEDAGGTAGLPVVTFSDEVTFHLDDLTAVLFHVDAAHTDGDGIIYFPDANVIHTGDVHFNYLFPFIDLDSGGSVAGYIAGQQRILEMADDDTVIIPGHGPLADKADLQVAVDMLVDAQARVKKLVDEGMSEEQILAANPLAGYHERWNWSFISTERMTSTLYRSLTAD